MRPIELQMTGFTAYREPTVVDFRGADLFALTGPTGSGKSSIVDAIVFALYGSVPRYGNKGAVEPVISLGKVEARIRFDFTVGEESYAAVRVVRRLKKGATTAEARLEHDTEVVASGADEVTEAVERLFGLTYDHFIKAVVLPQGDFARFLHDRPAKRQELLRALLDLGIYRQVRDLANQRKASVDARAELYRVELDGLSDLARQDEQFAAERLKLLEQLRDDSAATGKKLEDLDRQIAKTAETIERRQAELRLLGSIREPDGIADLAERIRRADKALTEAKVAAERGAAALAEQEDAASALPAAPVLESQLAMFRRRNDLMSRRAEAVGRVAEAEEAVRLSRTDAEAVGAALAGARSALDNLRREHAAHELAASVQLGEPCPVCGVPVASMPQTGTIPDLRQAEVNVEHKVAAADGAGRSLTDAEVTAAKAKAALDELDRQLAPLDDELADAGPVEQLTELLAAARRAQERLVELKAAARAADAALSGAEQRRTGLTDEETAAWQTFQSTRDKIASLAPPAADMSALAADWKTLTSWAVERTGEVQQDVGDLQASSTELSEERGHLAAGLDQQLTDAGLTSEESVEESVIEAVFAAKTSLDRIRRAKKRSAELTTLVAAEQERSVIAATLVKHLNAGKFESWLLEEALHDLTIGANGLLAALSGDAYSLEVARNEFVIVDHRNADQRRSVRTLSGGETFLASLALALSLSEQLTRMAMRGEAKLESIFLDEGFGTLDQETLDVVASVVHELGATGRTVGLISHVSDLAEQVPTRYVVSKDVSGARIERIDA